MAKKKTSKKAVKKTTKRPVRKVAKKTAKKTTKKVTKKTTAKKQAQPIDTRKIIWFLFGKLLVLAIILYGILYIIFEKNIIQGLGIISFGLIIWIIAILIKHRKR